MTTYTLTELATRALKEHNLVGAEETPSAADLAWSIETCQSVVSFMAADRIPIWNGSDVSVPLEYFAVLASRCGLSMATSYGLMTIDRAEAAAEFIDRKLRRINQVGPTGATQQSDYF